MIGVVIFTIYIGIGVAITIMTAAYFRWLQVADEGRDVEWDPDDAGFAFTLGALWPVTVLPMGVYMLIELGRWAIDKTISRRNHE